MSSLKRSLVLFLLFFITVIPVFSHPHTFIDTIIECEFNEAGLSGFWINWSFDSMFTSSIIMDYDLDRDGAFSEKEIDDIEENAFSNLVNYNYFIWITENRKSFRPEKVEDFTAEIKGNDIIYRFFVPYKSIPEEKGNTVILAVYDETFFCDIAIKSAKAVPNINSDLFSIDMNVRKNEEKTITYDNSFQSVTRDGASYPGYVNPQEMMLRFSEK